MKIKFAFLIIMIIIIITACTKEEKETLYPQEIKQWAYTATASNSAGGEYGANRDDQSAYAATGEPDVDGCVESMYAWTTKDADMHMQTLTLNYYDDIYFSKIRILETQNPGAITKIELKNNDDYITLWEGTYNIRDGDCPYWLEKEYIEINGNITKKMTSFKTDTVRLTINTDIPGWNEIDAVELIGYTDKWYRFNNTLIFE